MPVPQDRVVKLITRKAIRRIRLLCSISLDELYKHVAQVCKLTEGNFVIGYKGEDGAQKHILYESDVLTALSTPSAGTLLLEILDVKPSSLRGDLRTSFPAAHQATTTTPSSLLSSSPITFSPSFRSSIPSSASSTSTSVSSSSSSSSCFSSLSQTRHSPTLTSSSATVASSRAPSRPSSAPSSRPSSAPSSPSLSPTQAWMCPRCTFANHVLIPKCEMCDASKPIAISTKRSPLVTSILHSSPLISPMLLSASPLLFPSSSNLSPSAPPRLSTPPQPQTQLSQQQPQHQLRIEHQPQPQPEENEEQPAKQHQFQPAVDALEDFSLSASLANNALSKPLTLPRSSSFSSAPSLSHTSIGSTLTSALKSIDVHQPRQQQAQQTPPSSPDPDSLSLDSLPPPGQLHRKTSLLSEEEDEDCSPEKWGWDTPVRTLALAPQALELKADLLKLKSTPVDNVRDNVEEVKQEVVEDFKAEDARLHEESLREASRTLEAERVAAEELRKKEEEGRMVIEKQMREQEIILARERDMARLKEEERSREAQRIEDARRAKEEEEVVRLMREREEETVRQVLKQKQENEARLREEHERELEEERQRLEQEKRETLALLEKLKLEQEETTKRAKEEAERAKEEAATAKEEARIIREEMKRVQDEILAKEAECARVKKEEEEARERVLLKQHEDESKKEQLEKDQFKLDQTPPQASHVSAASIEQNKEELGETSESSAVSEVLRDEAMSLESLDPFAHLSHRLGDATALAREAVHSNAIADPRSEQVLGRLESLAGVLQDTINELRGLSGTLNASVASIHANMASLTSSQLLPPMARSVRTRRQRGSRQQHSSDSEEPQEEDSASLEHAKRTRRGSLSGSLRGKPASSPPISAPVYALSATTAPSTVASLSSFSQLPLVSSTDVSLPPSSCASQSMSSVAFSSDTTMSTTSFATTSPALSIMLPPPLSIPPTSPSTTVTSVPSTTPIIPAVSSNATQSVSSLAVSSPVDQPLSFSTSLQNALALLDDSPANEALVVDVSQSPVATETDGELGLEDINLDDANVRAMLSTSNCELSDAPKLTRGISEDSEDLDHIIVDGWSMCGVGEGRNTRRLPRVCAEDEAKLAQLRALGYTNRSFNLVLLGNYAGDLSKVISALQNYNK